MLQGGRIFEHGIHRSKLNILCTTIFDHMQFECDAKLIVKKYTQKNSLEKMSNSEHIIQ